MFMTDAGSVSAYSLVQFQCVFTFNRNIFYLLLTAHVILELPSAPGLGSIRRRSTDCPRYDNHRHPANNDRRENDAVMIGFSLGDRLLITSSLLCS